MALVDRVRQDPYIKALAGDWGEDIERAVTASLVDETSRGVLVILHRDEWRVQLSRSVPFGSISIRDATPYVNSQ